MNTHDRTSHFLKRLGARILSEANDLKRTPEALAHDIGMDIGTVRSVIEGIAPADTARSVVVAMSEKYPISLASVSVEPDDTERGVRIMRAGESARSSRVFDRKDKNDETTPYYEYRDTAMSKLAPFKPEWIQPIRFVDDCEAANPDVAYNKGHLMHQCTFFIGEVNFYWQIDGEYHAAEMNTGDSNYITPFVPHSFTSRNSNRPGLIIAVTYSGQVRRAIDEISMIGSDGIHDLIGGGTVADIPFSARLRRYMNAESLGSEDLAKRLKDAGMKPDKAERIVDGGLVPVGADIEVVASALSIRPTDLASNPSSNGDAVILRYAEQSPMRAYPNGNKPVYRLRELARTQQQPELKGFDMNIISNGWENGGVLRHSLHQYVYNYGDTPAAITWRDNDQEMTDMLLPGDSAYVRPMTPHAFGVSGDSSEANLAVVRVPGLMNNNVLDEFATFAPAGRARVAEETTQWF